MEELTHSLFDENGNQNNDQLSNYISVMHGLGGDCLEDYYCGDDPTCKLRYIRFEGNLQPSKGTSGTHALVIT